MKTLKLNTIYSAFMGEVNVHGIGVPCTFVRLAGCNLRCYLKTKGCLCDTPEALSMNSGTAVTTSVIIQAVRSHGNKVVCLTGGEPLMQDVTELLTELSNEGFHVVVETNGSKSIAPYRHIRNVSFVVDVKSPSSGEDERMLEENYSLLNSDDFVKFVVDTADDYETFRDWVMSHNYLDCNIAVGVFWGSEVTYDGLIKSLREEPPCTPIWLNMQTHKMACLYDSHKESAKDIFIPKDL